MGPPEGGQPTLTEDMSGEHLNEVGVMGLEEPSVELHMAAPHVTSIKKGVGSVAHANWLAARCMRYLDPIAQMRANWRRFHKFPQTQTMGNPR